MKSWLHFFSFFEKKIEKHGTWDKMFPLHFLRLKRSANLPLKEALPPSPSWQIREELKLEESINGEEVQCIPWCSWTSTYFFNVLLMCFFFWVCFMHSLITTQVACISGGGYSTPLHLNLILRCNPQFQLLLSTKGLNPNTISATTLNKRPKP